MTTETEALEKRVVALEQAIAFIANEKPQSPVQYETYKKLRDRVATLEVLEASHEGSFRLFARFSLGFFSWLGGITTMVFAEWVRAQFFSIGQK